MFCCVLCCCFLWVLADLHTLFTYILECYFTVSGVIVWLPRYHCSYPDGCGSPRLVPNRAESQQTLLHRPIGDMGMTLIARFKGPTWGPSGADRTQVGPMLAPWTLLSGEAWTVFCNFEVWFDSLLDIFEHLQYRVIFDRLVTGRECMKGQN